MVEFALFLPPEPNRMWALGPQMGVRYAVTGLPQSNPGAAGRAEGNARPWDFLPLLHLQGQFRAAGYEIAVIESSPPMERIRLGLPGRDEEIEWFCTMLRSLGALGIPTVCWNFMAGFGWQRTSLTTPTRGGALATSYAHAPMIAAPPVPEAISEDALWENLAYFLRAVVPVAEEARVKLALHPDDPPLSPIRGMGRIMRSVEAFDRALDLVPSPYHGITYCQGNFALMGANHADAVPHFAARGALHFVHFRDVRGDVTDFAETFHDDGPTDMLAAMRTYHTAGFGGVMRCDHAPVMAGEVNDHPGYETLGRIFAIGYMTGLREAVRAEGIAHG